MKTLGKFVVDVFKHCVVVHEGLPDWVKGNVQARCEFESGTQQIDIYVTNKDAFQGYVMHECVHAADFILNNIGADMGTNPNDSEVRAYLAEYIFCKVGVVLGHMKEHDLFSVLEPKPEADEKTEPVEQPTEPPVDIFDTQRVDDVPPELNVKTNAMMPTLWREKRIDLNKNYLGSYSNPCSTSVGKCGRPCVQTELWLYDKETDYLSTVDVEFADRETLQATLDPLVEYAKKHRVLPVWEDKATNDAMDDLAAAAKEHRVNRAEQDEKLKTKVSAQSAKTDGKTRIEQFLNLYNRGFKTSQIAREMGITEQYVYNLKNQAKTKGLIK